MTASSLYEGGSNDENCAPEEEFKDGGVQYQFPFQPGELLDVLDSASKWSEAQVLQVDPINRSVLISYIYWSDKFNEWISTDSDRLAPSGSMTYHEGDCMLRLGHRIEAQDPLGNWYEAEVIAENPSSVRVHYMNWATKFDEDLPRNSPRIRPYGRHKQLKPKMRPVTRSTTSIRTQAQQDRRRLMASSSHEFSLYQHALHAQNLGVRQVDGDGNCMFRSVAHQVYGDEELHALVRDKCLNYMESEREYFEPFVEGDMGDFLRYLAHKRQLGVWGDDPEIQACSELYNRPAEIWSYDQHSGARVMKTFHESASSGQSGNQQQDHPVMRLSYYGGGHYDSIVGASHASHLIREPPGEVEDARIAQRVALGDRGVEEARVHSDRAATEEAELNLALEASRLDFDTQDDSLETLFRAQTEVALSAADAEATDEALLRSAEQRELQQVLALSTSTHQNPSGNRGAAAESSDAELELALSVSLVDGVDPELQHALEASKQAGGLAYASHSAGSASSYRNLVFGEDDAALSTALAMSLEYQKEHSQVRGQGGGVSDDIDEETQRAIELSQQGIRRESF